MADAVWAKAQQIGNQPYEAYTGQLVQGQNADQQAAYDLIRKGVNSNVGGDWLNAAGQTALRAANYTPQQITAPMMGQVAMAGGGSASAAEATASNLGLANTYGGASVNRGDIRDATGQTGVSYMDPYVNRWENDVVSTTLSDLDRARQRTMIQGEDAAIRSGGYGGSRHGVADSLTNEAALRQAASTAAQLRSLGFTTAAGLGQNDADRYMQAGLTNQGYDASVAGQNAGFQQQAGLANAAAQNQYGITQAQLNDAMSQYNASAKTQTSMANAQMAQQASMANAAAQNSQNMALAQMNMQANQANQNAGLSAANLGLGASSALANLSDQQRQSLMQNSAALEAIGGSQQAQGQRGLDSAYNQWLRQQNNPYQQLQALTGSVGNYGQTTTQNPSTAAQVGQGVNSIGALLSLLGG